MDWGLAISLLLWVLPSNDECLGQMAFLSGKRFIKNGDRKPGHAIANVAQHVLCMIFNRLGEVTGDKEKKDN